MHSVLYVDDEPLLQKVTKLYLERNSDFSVDTVESAKEALSILKNRSYDAIISDYQMYDMDGIELLKELRKSGDNTPFIIFTGRGREDVVIEAFESGADFYLQKGGDPKAQFAELIHKIKQAVSRHKTEKALVESELKFRNIVENSPDLIIQRNAEGYALYVSPSSESILGYKPEELIGTHFSELMGPEEAERALKHNYPLSSGIKPGPIQLKLLKKDGSYADVECSASYLNGKDESGGIQTISRDISYRIKAEEEIRSRDELYRSLAETVPGMIYIVDPEGRLLFVNSAAAAGFGKKSEEITGKNLYEIYPEEQAGGHMKAVKAVIGSGKPFYREMVEKLPAGDFWISVRLTPLKNSSGNITGVLGISYDITPRKRVEEALKKSESQYSETLNAMTEAVSVVDENLNFLLVNEAFRKMARENGYEVPDNVLGLNIKDAIPFLPEEILEEYRKVFSTGEALKNEERIKVGEKTIYAISIKIPVFSDGNVAKVVTVLHDITQVKKAKSDLRESGEFIRVLFDSARDAIFIKNRNLEYTHVNPYMCDLFGLTPDEIIGKTDRKIFGERVPYTIHDSDMEVLEGRTCSYDISHWLKGEKYHFSVVKVPLRDEDGSVFGICGISRDITGRKHTENALGVANRKLSLLSKITRHDLRNKITAILGYCELARDETENESVLRLIEREEASLEEMTTIIEFLKKYETVESEPSRWLSLQSELTGYISGVETGGIPVDLDLEGLEIFSDAIFIRIFSDLINNSVIHGGSVSNIRIGWKVSDEQIKIVYGDDGAGIPADIKEKIFVKGFGKGSGLGLYYIREILGVIGMTIAETGEEGKGAVFEIMVPVDICRFPQSG